MSFLRGVDVSFPGDAEAMKAAGLDFALTEAVVNGTSQSSSAAGNIAAFKAAGLLCGGYIFAIYARRGPDGALTTTDPVAAGKACAAIFNKLPQLDIPAALDVEQPIPGSSPPNYTLPIPGPMLVDWCIRFARAFLADYTAFPVMLFYSFPSYTAQFRDALAARANEIENLFLPWHASPSGAPFPAENAVPFQADSKKTQFFLERPWGKRWSFWQTQGNARLPGIPHIVDVDVFDGTREDLQNIGRSTIGPVVVSPPVGPAVSPAPGVVPAVPGASVTPTKAGVLAALIAGLVAVAAWWFGRR